MQKIMTVKELLAKTEQMLNCRTVYVNGCFGAPLNYGTNLNRYTTNNDYNKRNAATIKAAADKAKSDGVPIFGGDCHCSFKGIAWGWNADANKVYGGAQYQSNGLPDCTINTHRDKYCEPYSTDFSNIVPGEALFYDKEGSHFGLYIGNGLVAENTPKWKNCFQITELWNVQKTMSNGRNWWAHAKMQWVDYSEEEKEETTMKTRSAFVKQAQSWLGYNEVDGSFKEIIDIYNSCKPLARGYAMKYTDEWCATFVSAVGIKLGYQDIILRECGCGEMIKLYQAKGQWVENDAYVPSSGDLIFYDWQDTGSGDNQGWSDHVGIVEKVENGIITVIEGNAGGEKVTRREVKINGQYIRGFAVPAFDKEDDKPEPSPEPTKDVFYRVQCGAYNDKKNAEAQVAKLKAAGFDAIIVEVEGTIPDEKPAPVELKVGDKVRLSENATVFGKTTKYQSWVYKTDLWVREIKGDRVVVSIYKEVGTAVTGAVDKKYLTKV